MIFKKCPDCGVENPETEVFCLECGARLDPEKTLAWPASPSAAPPPMPKPAPVEAAPPATPPPSGPGRREETPKPDEETMTFRQPRLPEPPAGPPAREAETVARPSPKPRVIGPAPKPGPRGTRSASAEALRITLLATAVIVAGVIVWRLAFRPGRRPAAAAPAAEKTSVAVLPFGQSGGTEDRGYFGEGLARSLTRGLSGLPGLRLPGASSHLLLSTKTADSTLIGRTLGARFILTGTFESADNSLRVTARLVRAADGSQLWESRFDRGPEEVLGIIKDLAQGAVGALKISASPEKLEALFKVRTLVPEACDLYFRALSLAGRRGKANLEKAVALFQQAAAQDPGWADAHAGLAAACVDLGSESLWSPDNAFPAARQAILKALELEAGMTEARLALAFLKWRGEWDFAAAEQEFREALRTNPGQPEIRRSFAFFLSSLGRHEEAQSEIKAALELDPLSPRLNTAHGMILYYARQYDLASAELTKARETSPSDSEPCYGLGLLHMQTGDLAESLRMFQHAAALGGDQRELSLRAGVVLARLGQRQEVGKILNEAIQASSREYVSSAALAAIYAGLLEPDQAQACLEKAFSEKDASLVFLKVSPLFDPVRSRPWFADMVNKIGL